MKAPGGRRRSLLSRLPRAPDGADQEARLRALEAGWNNYLPAFLNAVSSVGAFGHELLGLRREVEALRGQAESLSHPLHGGAATPPLTRIAAPEEVAKAIRSGLKLHLADGEAPRAGYVIVASEDGPGVDVIAGPGELPFEPASVREIWAGCLIDRIAPQELTGRLLPHWRALLAPGGRLGAAFSNAEDMISRLAAGACSFDDFRARFLEVGEGGYYRGALFTPDDLHELLSEAGFDNIEIGRAAGGFDHAYELSARRR
jgi:hypothetical protein